MLKELLIATATITLFASQAAWADPPCANVNLDISPVTLATQQGVPLNFTATASGTGVNAAHVNILKVQSQPSSGNVTPTGDQAGISKTFTYTPPATVSSTTTVTVTIRFKDNTANCQLDVTKNITISPTCATPITWNTTVPALTVNAGSLLTYTPSGALASGGSGAITYSAIVNTLSTDAGSLTLNSATGGFTYTSGASFSGNYSFTLVATAGQCQAQQGVVISVQPASSCVAPGMPNFSFSTPVNTAYTAAPTTSGGTTPYTYSLGATAPAHGSVVLNNAATGNYTYTPTAGYSGPDSFTLNVASSCTDTSVTPNIVNPSATATAGVTVGAAASSCVAPTISNFSLIVPSGATSASFTPAVSGGTTPYVFSLPSTTTTHGTVAITNSSTGQVTYTPTTGYTGNDSFSLVAASSCGGNPSATAAGAVTVSSTAVAGSYGTTTGNIAASGAIIIDNTPNPGTPGVVTNMNTNVGGKNFGAGNAFNIDGIQVMQRDISVTPQNLVDEAGVTNTASTSYQNYGTSRQTTYFANGQHLFDLDRLRRAANWMRVPSGTIGLTSNATIPDATTGNTANLMTAAIPANQITPSAACTGSALRPANALGGTAPQGRTPIGSPMGSCHPAGTYGTITWREFLDNIANARTMYGVVRILVPLKLGTTKSSNNALNQTVGTTNIYGFCSGPTNKTDTTPATEWCADAPTEGTDIKGGAAVAGNYTGTAISIPAITTTAGQLRVRGTLMFDFVNGTTDTVYGAPGHPIGLDHLPFQPRDIYFKVSVPINVDAGNDILGDGIVDNLDYINSLTSVITCARYPCSTIIPNTTAVSNTQVPQESIDSYNFQYGTTYTSNADPAFVTLYNGLNKPNQYHLLMASGYVDGWYDAFRELGVTAQQWLNVGFAVPPNANLTQPLSINDIRSNTFEDIPVYLYTGGLVDMHHHMNVSGLIYVPQAAEIEQKFSGIRMYMNGGLIVRDGFFLEGAAGGVTLISSDPQSFSSIKVLAGAIQGAMLSAATSTLHDASAASSSPLGVGIGGGAGGAGGAGTASNPCVGCGGGQVSVGKIRWIEIRPQ